MHNTEYISENETQTPLRSGDTNSLPNLSQMTRPCNNQQQQKKKDLLNCEFCYPG